MHGADEHPHVEGEAEKEVEEGHGCPVEGPVTCSFFKNLCDAFGWKLLLLVGLAEITLKGFLAGGGTGGLVGTPIEFLLKEYEVKAADLQVYKSAVSIPWAIKPLFGLIADSMPILRFNRTSYFALNSICGVSALFLIGFFPSLSLPILLLMSLSLPILLLMLFLVFMDIAWSDLLTEAVYSTHLREKPDQGPSLISFIWGGIGIGKLFCTSIVGILMEKVGNRAPYLIAALAAAFTLLITFLNLPEETSRRGRCCKKLGGSEMPLAIVGLVIGLGALSLALLSVFGGNLYTKVICAGILAVVALSLVSAALTPIVAKVNAFFFIQSICSFSISGASFYFFTDGPEAYPDGPHLSKVQKAATKKARQAQGEAVIAARVAEAGYEGQARSEALKVAHDAHFARVMHEKTDRLAEDAATKRALREERAAAAAGRRCLSEARARFARHWLSPAIEAQDDGNLPSLLADDPVVRKARALCSGVAQAVSQLEEQNQLLKSKASLQLMNIPRSEPPRERKSPTPFQGPFDNEELIAKAKELLSDYKPEKQRLPSARSSARTTPTREPSSHGSPRQGDLSALQRARQQCTDVCIELSTKSRAMKR